MAGENIPHSALERIIQLMLEGKEKDREIEQLKKRLEELSNGTTRIPL